MNKTLPKSRTRISRSTLQAFNRPRKLLSRDPRKLRWRSMRSTPTSCAKMDAWWRAANYLSIGQTYLYDNRCLKNRSRRST